MRRFGILPQIYSQFILAQNNPRILYQYAHKHDYSLIKPLKQNGSPKKVNVTELFNIKKHNPQKSVDHDVCTNFEITNDLQKGHNEKKTMFSNKSANAANEISGIVWIDGTRRKYERPDALVDILNDINKSFQHESNSVDWSAVSKTISENTDIDVGWQTRLMKMLMNEKHLDTDQSILIAKSLMEYIRNKNMVNIAILSYYISVLGRQGFGQNERIICETYDEVQEKIDAFEGITGSAVIRGLSKTKRWKECIKVLEDIMIISFPTSNEYGEFISAAFHHNDLETAWKYLDIISEYEISPNLNVIETIITKYPNCDPGGQVSQLILYLKKKSIILDKEAVEYLTNFLCRIEKRTYRKSKIARGHYCTNCGHKMEKQEELTPEVFDIMKKNFMEKVVLKKDIFLNASTEELKKFEIFLEETGPVDVVIDALNVTSIIAKNVKKSKETKPKMLLGAVDFFKKKGQRVMVFGRKHMVNWHFGVMDEVQDKAHCFFTNDSSADDPFMVYAALHSGQHTMLVTRDELRNHSVLLEDMRRDFRAWQRAHQIYPISFYTDKSPSRYTFVIKYPSVYKVCIQQGTENTWHIPFNDGSDRKSYELATSWMCLSKPNL